MENECRFPEENQPRESRSTLPPYYSLTVTAGLFQEKREQHWGPPGNCSLYTTRLIIYSSPILAD